MLEHYSIRVRLHFIGIVALIGLSVIAALGVGSLSRHMRVERLRGTHDQLDTAISILARFEAEARAGRLTQEAARTGAMATIRALRFGDGNYFWINDESTRVLMHPIKPGLEGTDGAAIKGPDGVSPFTLAVAASTADGGGAFNYDWPKPGGDVPIEKISYARRFAPWGWIVGTGVYADDIAADVRSAGLLSALEFMLAAAVVAGVAFVLARGVTRPLIAMTSSLVRLANGDVSVPAGAPMRTDEIGTMEKAMVELRVEVRRSFELCQMFDQMQSNVLACSVPDFNITYLNAASRALLGRLAKDGLLSVDPNDLLGQSIDIFHKDPGRIRKLLADPKNLPHRTQIRLGPEIIYLNISAVYDRDGTYTGPMLIWNDWRRSIRTFA